jgi:hypothetical protein
MEPNSIGVPPSQPVPQVQSQNLSAGTFEGPVSLFKSSWIFFWKNWKTLVPIVILPIASFSLGQILVLFGNSILFIFVLVLFAIGMILSVASQPAIIDAIHKLHNGIAAIVLVDQYKLGFKMFWSVIFLGILQALILFGASVLFIIPAFIVGIYLVMYMYTLVLDKKKGLQSLTESYSLITGRWFDVLGRLLFVGLVYIGFAIVVAGVSFVISTIFGFKSNSIPQAVLSVILNLILGGAMGTLVAVYLYKVYSSLKSTRKTDINVLSFKKWLIAFSVLGLIAMVAIFVAAIVFGSSFLMNQ